MLRGRPFAPLNVLMAPAGEGGESGGGGPPPATAPAPAPSATPTPAPAPAAPSATDFAKLQSQLAALQELVAGKDKDLDATKKAAAALEADAKVGRDFTARETARIEDAKKALPAEQQKLVDALGSLDQKSALIAALLAKAPAAPAPPPGGPPGDQLDFDAAYRDPVKWADAKKRDPKGASEWFAKALMGGEGGARRPLAFLNPTS